MLTRRDSWVTDHTHVSFLRIIPRRTTERTFSASVGSSFEPPEPPDYELESADKHSLPGFVSSMWQMNSVTNETKSVYTTSVNLPIAICKKS